MNENLKEKFMGWRHVFDMSGMSLLTGWERPTRSYKGYQMVPSNLKVLAKFGLCSNCSEKLDECSLARARKIFASARMLGFSFKSPAVFRKHNLHLENKNWRWTQFFPHGELGGIGETFARRECFWKSTSSFCRRLLKLTGLSSVPGSRVTLHETFRLKRRAIFNPLEREPTCL